MNGAFMSLLMIESVLTAAAVIMLLYRAMLDMKEEDHIILDAAEQHLDRDQETIRHKVNTVSRYIKVVGVAWGVMLVVIMGVWVVRGLALI